MARLTSRSIELNRVVITGMGAVTPLGNDVPTTWGALLKGVSGIAPLEGFRLASAHVMTTLLGSALLAGALLVVVGLRELAEKNHVPVREDADLVALLSTLAGLIGVEAMPEFGEARPGEVRDSQADIGKARRLLGYEPAIPFEEGLRQTVAWYRGERA